MSELYELPDGWEWKELDTLAKFQSGGTPKRSNKSYWDNGNIPWIKISDINENMYVNSSVEYITEDGLDNSSAKLFSKGTILYTIFATIGKIGILNIEATTNQAISGITPNKDTDTFYLYYGLKFITNEIKKISTGVAQNNINLTKLKAQFLPVPPLSEQQRIVSKLDKLFEKIDKSIALHQKNMDEADAFMGSVLNDVFGELEEKYGTKIWNDVLTIKNGKHYKDVIDDNGQYPIYGSGGIMNYANQYICNEDTVIIGRKGTINSPIFVKEKFWNIDTAFGIESNREFLSPMFLFYFTKQFNFLDLNKSTTLPSLAKTNLLQITMVVPPFHIQQKVVKYLDEVSQNLEKIKSVQKEKMDSLVALKASILDKAFRGKL